MFLHANWLNKVIVNMIGVSNKAPCKSVWELSPNTMIATDMFAFPSFPPQYLFRAGNQASPVCTSPYYLIRWIHHVYITCQNIVAFCKFTFRHQSVIRNMLIIISLISNTGTVTSVPAWSCTFTLVGLNVCVWFASSIDLRNDFLDCNFEWWLKFGEDVYSLTRWQILSYICKLALCLLIKLCSMIWNLFMAMFCRGCMGFKPSSWFALLLKSFMSSPLKSLVSK